MKAKKNAQFYLKLHRHDGFSELTDQLKTQFIDNQLLPNLHLEIQQAGHPVFSSALGWQDIEAQKPLASDTIFYLYSMTKPVTAVAALQLIDQGHLNLDDPLEQYLTIANDSPDGLISNNCKCNSS